VGPCPVLQVKAKGTKRSGADGTGQGDGYDAIQIGFLDKVREKANRAERGHVAKDLESKRRKELASAGVTMPPKADCEPQRHITECRLDKPAEVAVGTLLNAADVFKDIKYVDVVGTSKGRGFTGSMKRHGFHGLPASHGAKKVHRSGGSISSMASNRGSGRPKKGHKAAGQYGNTRRTVRNLDIVRIDGENHLVIVKGAVPGPNGGLIFIRPTNKQTSYKVIVQQVSKKAKKK
jgi:large subunit ribosomal protein L3